MGKPTEKALKPWGVTSMEVDDVITNATKQQVKQAEQSPEFIEPAFDPADGWQEV